MSDYGRLVNGIKYLAETMLPNITVFQGTVDQISRDSIDNDLPMIGIQEGFTMTQREVPDNVKSGSIIIDFALPDNFDSTVEQTTNIVQSIDVLIDQFLDELYHLYQFYNIEITDISRAPFYKRTAATYSGMLLQFTFQIGMCDINIFPDLKEYQEYMGRNINPLDWKGITKRQ